MLSDKITSFFFSKEDKVAFNEKKKQMNTLKYLSIIIKICFIYLKKNMSIITFKEIIWHLEKLFTMAFNLL